MLIKIKGNFPFPKSQKLPFCQCVCVFGHFLRWRNLHLRNKLFIHYFRTLLVSDVISWLHYLMYCFSICGLFSNSFVVNEASLVAFTVATSVVLHAYKVLSKPCQETRRTLHFVLVLFLLGLLRFV